MQGSFSLNLGVEIIQTTDTHNELTIRVYDEEGDQIYIYAFTGEHLRANLKRYLEKLREEEDIQADTERDYFRKINRFISFCIMNEIPPKRMPNS